MKALAIIILTILIGLIFMIVFYSKDEERCRAHRGTYIVSRRISPKCINFTY